MDKAGKTTQSNLLEKSLISSGKKAIVVNFPDYSTFIGTEIKNFLDGKRTYPIQVQHMLLSANRWERYEQISNLLKDGYIIIMNRYYQSNLVYGISNGLTLEWVRNLDHGLPKEDLVLILEVDPGISQSRSSFRDSFENNLYLLNKVLTNYRILAEQFGWIIIDGTQQIELVHKAIMNEVSKLLKLDLPKQ